MSPHDFRDMHESALIFVLAATFGQIIAKCDNRAAAAATGRQNLKSSHFDPARWQSLPAEVTGGNERTRSWTDLFGTEKIRLQQEATDVLTASRLARSQHLSHNAFRLAAGIISANACWRGF
jgi:hypothetical protein